MSGNIRKHMPAINALIKAIEALQAEGVGVEIEQLEDGRFDVGASLDTTDVIVNASFPKQQEEAA